MDHLKWNLNFNHKINVLLIVSLFVFSFKSTAQNTFSAVVKDNKTGENLIGATAFIKKLNIGASSDIHGILKIEGIPNGEYEIIFSYLGYEKRKLELEFPGQIQVVEVLMKNESAELEEVTVSSTRTNSRIEDSPIRIEIIGQEEVNEEGAIRPANISKLLTESSSIQVQPTSAINGNVSIRLQGLDGKYTQILKDGFPLYGGFSQGLSIMQIPPLDLKQVEIIKGSASSLYGSDAIAGIINLVTKQPNENRELTFLVNQTSLRGTDANGYFSKRGKKIGFTFLTSNNLQSHVDVNKDGFSTLPKSTTSTFAPTLYYYIDSVTTLRLGVNASFDNRIGGDMQVLDGDPDSLHTYYQENISNRYSSQLKFDRQLASGSSVVFKSSFCKFKRSINEYAAKFSGEQFNSYSEASYNFKISNHNLVTGINFISDGFIEDSTKSHLKRDYNYMTSGIFIQDNWKINEKLIIESGIRNDYQNKYGLFLLPRLAFMYKVNSSIYMRAGTGSGYKLPNIFSAASEKAGINNIYPLSDDIKAEWSIGSNLDVNITRGVGNGFVTLNQSFFTTQITDPLILDSFYFQNKSSSVITYGSETNLRYRLDEFKVFVAYTYLEAQRKYNTEQPIIPLTPRHKLIVDIFLEEEEEYAVALEGLYISSMYRDYDTRTKGFFTIGVIAQKHFKQITLIANAENLLDMRQSRIENIVIPPASSPEFREVYAPLEGRVFSLGMKIKL